MFFLVFAGTLLSLATKMCYGVTGQVKHCDIHSLVVTFANFSCGSETKQDNAKTSGISYAVDETM